MNLTYEEYTQLSTNPVGGPEFDKLLKRAITVINVITRYFYESNNFEDDNDFRKKRVKEALTFQIDHFAEVGETTFEGMNRTPQSVSLGRTTITQTSSRVADNTRVISITPQEAISALQGTGLLNRGVGTW